MTNAAYTKAMIEQALTSEIFDRSSKTWVTLESVLKHDLKYEVTTHENDPQIIDPPDQERINGLLVAMGHNYPHNHKHKHVWTRVEDNQRILTFLLA